MNPQVVFCLCLGFYKLNKQLLYQAKLLALASYLTGRHKSGVNLLIQVSARISIFPKGAIPLSAVSSVFFFMCVQTFESKVEL